MANLKFETVANVSVPRVGLLGPHPGGKIAPHVTDRATHGLRFLKRQGGVAQPANVRGKLDLRDTLIQRGWHRPFRPRPRLETHPGREGLRRRGGAGATRNTCAVSPDGAQGVHPRLPPVGCKLPHRVGAQGAIESERERERAPAGRPQHTACGTCTVRRSKLSSTPRGRHSTSTRGTRGRWE
jgi:hypothetical protein